jgi:NhaP-type Na+/H+ or K+/H+ antiporter
VHGVPEQLASWLTDMTLAVVTTSVIVHGISVTPFMRHYDRTSD